MLFFNSMSIWFGLKNRVIFLPQTNEGRHDKNHILQNYLGLQKKSDLLTVCLFLTPSHPLYPLIDQSDIFIWGIIAHRSIFTFILMQKPCDMGSADGKSSKVRLREVYKMPQCHPRRIEGPAYLPILSSFHDTTLALLCTFPSQGILNHRHGLLPSQGDLFHQHKNN